MLFVPANHVFYMYLELSVAARLVYHSHVRNKTARNVTTANEVNTGEKSVPFTINSRPALPLPYPILHGPGGVWLRSRY